MDTYKKKYDEALERARKLKENPQMVFYEYSPEEGDTICDYIFPELKESEDERIRGAIIDHLKDNNLTEWSAWLEKQGNHKLADKVEPKFKVGDWVFIEEIEGYKQGPFQIKYLSKQGYCFDKDRVIPFCTEDLMSFWTIQDAKEGDVLSDGTTIFIFKDLLSDGSVMSYCDYDTDSGESDSFCPLSVNLMCSKITPATKKQRDLLFQKMKDSGYKWNAEKKELEKIEEEINGEDYGIDSLYHAQRILEKTLGSVDGYQSDDGILEHKCAIAAVKKLYKQNSSWSEDDEKILKKIIQDYEAASKSYCGHQGKLEWLKSLRPQPKQEWHDKRCT